MDTHNAPPRSPSQEVFTSLLRPPAPRQQDDRHTPLRISVDDISPVLLNSDVLREIQRTGWLDEYVTGSFARVSNSDDDHGGRWVVYQVTGIRGLPNSAYIEDEGHRIIGQCGSKKLDFLISQISNAPPTPEEFEHFIRMQELAKHSLPTRSQLESKARNINRIHSLVQVPKDTRVAPPHARNQTQPVIKEPLRPFAPPMPESTTLQNLPLPSRFSDPPSSIPHPPPTRFAAAIPPASMDYKKFSSEPSSFKVVSPVIHPLTPPPSHRPSSQQPIDSGKSLDVSDALSYLDLVKMQFESLPATYNQFLDVMKDFKSSAIDTPGVIERVSQLFQGHPRLIQGFNTFLPPGYLIKCSEDSNVITVITPSGTTHKNASGMDSAAAIVPTPVVKLEAQVKHQSPPSAPLPSSVMTLPPPPVVAMTAMTPVIVQAEPVAAIDKSTLFPQRPPSPLPASLEQSAPGSAYANTTTSSAQSPLPGLAAGFDPTLQQPMSLGTTDSISSTAPAKQASPGVVGPSASSAATVLGGMNRVPSDPPPKEPATEFHHAMTYINRIKTRYPDKQDVYKGFLQLLQSYQKEQVSIQEAYSQVAVLFGDAPDLLEEFKVFLPDTSAGASGRAGSSVTNPSVRGSSGWQQSDQDFGSSRKKADGTATAVKRRRRAADVSGAGRAGGKAKRARNTQNSGRMDQPSPTPGYSHQVTTSSSPPRPAPAHPAAITMPIFTAPIVSDDPVVAFFENLKRSLGDPEAYDEFLNVLQMFSMDILDAKTLLDRLEPFLTEEEMQQFIELLGWEQDIEKPLAELERDAPSRRRALRQLSKTSPRQIVTTHIGPSYRSTPLSEVGLSCSGRDELCRSVLNDRWESHPTWASEESGFVTHKKNSFEDAMYRTEEERYEYQFHIEAMGKTLSLLEPLLQKIEEMSYEDRHSFRLPPNLGSDSPSIHQRIIKKVYGREAGLEIIQALQEFPAFTIPVVVHRLRLKDEEWRRGQREWSKTWRDVDARNFYKSLDHQGITFKPNDKKNTTAKFFVSQIEGARDEIVKNATSLSTLQAQQLELAFTDTDVLHDALKLCFSFLDRQTLTYSAFERKFIEHFLRRFVPLLLDKDFVTFDSVFDRSMPEVEEDADVEMESTKDAPPGDGEEIKLDGVDTTDQEDELLSRIDDMWIKRAQGDEDSNGTADLANGAASSRIVYTNTTFYVLIRLLHLLYTRLLNAKNASAEAAKDTSNPWQANEIAVELGINDTAWCATAATASAIDKDLLSPTHLYDFLLATLARVIDGELDQQAFEDCTRVAFGTQAYTLSTMDKLLPTLLKQAQTAACDRKGGLHMLREQRQNKAPSVRDQIKYRIQAQLTANSDENVYKINLMPESDVLAARILRKEDSSVDVTETTRYNVYTESYFINQPTEGLHQAPSVPFLKRNLVRKDSGEAQTTSLCELAIHIDATRYVLKYEGEGEDIFVRYGLDKRRLKVGNGKVKLKLDPEETKEDSNIASTDISAVA